MWTQCNCKDGRFLNCSDRGQSRIISFMLNRYWRSCLDGLCATSESCALDWAVTVPCGFVTNVGFETTAGPHRLELAPSTFACTTQSINMDDSDSSLSSAPPTDDEKLAPIFKKMKVKAKKVVKPAASPPPPSPPRRKRTPSPPHIESLADNPHVAVSRRLSSHVDDTSYASGNAD